MTLTVDSLVFAGCLPSSYLLCRTGKSGHCQAYLSLQESIKHQSSTSSRTFSSCATLPAFRRSSGVCEESPGKFLRSQVVFNYCMGPLLLSRSHRNCRPSGCAGLTHLAVVILARIKCKERNAESRPPVGTELAARVQSCQDGPKPFGVSDKRPYPLKPLGKPSRLRCGVHRTRLSARSIQTC